MNHWINTFTIMNNELKSRREFFKEAAMKVLPLLGSLAVSQTSLLAEVI